MFTNKIFDCKASNFIKTTIIRFQAEEIRIVKLSNFK